MFSRIFRPAFGLFSVLALPFALTACGSSSSVVTDSTTQSKPATASATPATSMTSAAPAPATSMTSAAPSTPAPAAPVQATPQPTMDPILKQAQANPGVPVRVPDSMRRPLNSEEMQKALQQLPPEVRAKIMGMRPMPSPSPQPAKK